jgi:hypothetical protein
MRDGFVNFGVGWRRNGVRMALDFTIPSRERCSGATALP